MRRRDFVRRWVAASAGAACLGAMGAPLLRSRRARAQDGAAPKRFVFLGTMSGCVPDRFWPTSAERYGFATEPLERHAADVAFIHGVSHPHRGDHKPFVMATNTDTQTAPSIDQLVAARMAEDGYDRAPLVHCGQSKNSNYRGWLSFGMDGTRVLPTASPRGVFRAAFDRAPEEGATTPGDASPGDDAAAARARVDRAIMEAVQADIDDLAPRLSAAERIKLTEHREAVLRILDRIAPGDTPGGGGAGTPTTACGEGEERLAADAETFLGRAKQHMDVLAMAFACDVRRVSSFMMTPLGHDNMSAGRYRGVEYMGGAAGLPGLGPEHQLEGLDLSGDLHQTVAHGWANNDDYAEAFARINRAECAVIAYLVDLLKSIPEGDGTVFDNTVIYWTSEHAGPNHGVNASRANFPTAVIAGRQMGLDVGRFIDLEGGNAIHGELLLALAAQAGAPLPRFGDATDPWAPILR